MSAVSLFDYLDQLRLDGFPDNWSERLFSALDDLEALGGVLERRYETSRNEFSCWLEKGKELEFAQRTGKVYSNLWKNFRGEEYFDETSHILKERFEKNGIVLHGETVLDDGCGGGRYSMALRKLGAGRVVGVDISEDAIDLARRKSPFVEEDVEFQTGSVLDLPFEDESFDFVFSNGVLHHTDSTEKGLQEIFRVLKPGGRVWLYLYGGKESLFWDIVDLCRDMLKDIPQAYTQDLMRVLCYPPARIFHRCDFFYVPVHRRYFASDVEKMVQDTGFVQARRLRRGVAHDWDEIVHENPGIHPYIYGEGEMRYLLVKA